MQSLKGAGEKSIVYIGDGVQLSNLMNTKEFDGLVGELVADLIGVGRFARALNVFSKSAAIVMISSNEGVSPKNIGPSMAA